MCTQRTNNGHTSSDPITIRHPKTDPVKPSTLETPRWRYHESSSIAVAFSSAIAENRRGHRWKAKAATISANESETRYGMARTYPLPTSCVAQQRFTVVHVRVRSRLLSHLANVKFSSFGSSEMKCRGRLRYDKSIHNSVNWWRSILRYCRNEK